jgi:glycerol dehydrogenase-like iron-containing ADH family enzyme
MATIKSTSYSIYIGNKSFDALNKFLSKNKYSSYYIICDEHTLNFAYQLYYFIFQSLMMLKLLN